MYNYLFSPIKIRGLELKNRIVLPAMGTKFANKDRTVTQQLINYHVARVKGGCGLNMVEVASVHTPSAPRGFVSISEDIYIPGLKSLTDAIHKANGKVGIQLWQGGLAAGFDQATMILLPSDMPVSPEMTLPGVTVEQMDEVVECFGKAAARAVIAGFDCVEVHAAHNYILHSFLSPAINRRTDEYGGSFENRARLPLRVIRAVRSSIPDTMPVFMRIDAHDDYLENGLTIEDIIAFCKLAKEAGVDVVNVSRGNIISAGIKYEVPPIDVPKGFNIDNAARIKAETGLITLGVGRVNDPQQAEDILAAGKVDLIGIGRAQLADPNFCVKAREGCTDDIVRCVGCNQGCYDMFADKRVPHISCLRNPALGKEAEYELQRTSQPKKVLIAGGGIGGVQAAIFLKLRGHLPILCEAGDKLGGQFLLAGEAPRKAEMKEAAEHTGMLAAKLGVEIRLKTKVTPDLIASIKPDAFINATGAEPIDLKVPGGDLPFVVQAHDVLAGKEKLEGKITVVGGGLVGLETAEYLSKQGCEVAVLEMLPEAGTDLGDLRKICVMENLYAGGVTIHTGVKVSEISNGKVTGIKEGQKVDFACDYVVAAIGSAARKAEELQKACRKAGIPYFVIGDAAKPRRALNATADALRIARLFDEPQTSSYALNTKKTVFVTGASSGMGLETLKQLLQRADHFNVRALVRPSEKNKKIMDEFRSEPSLKIVWGDLKDYKAILEGVTGVDYVLHIGAFVSPMADNDPEEAMRVNLGSTLNIIKAIKAQPNKDEIKLAYVGTVAETGCRMDPIHWGRCGDPIKPSMFDYYAVSKVASERAVFESGLKYWVSLRQTGIMPAKESAGEDPIIFHHPSNNVLEWVTAFESGILMANVCEDWVPETFWKKCYNIGGGQKWRFTAWEYYNINMRTMGINYKQLFEPNQIAKFNFHGQWYTDSDALNDVLHFRVMQPEQYFGAQDFEIQTLMANPMIRAMIPTAEQMYAKNQKIANEVRGTNWMFETNQEDWIKAFFGSREKQAAIKSWEEGYELYHPSETPTFLNHGYDETKPASELDLSDMKGAAEFRGGKCLSASLDKGDLFTPLKWQCAFGHVFEATPNLILKGGHWCDECERDSWNYAEIADVNPFFAQVWKPIHGDEDRVKVKKAVNDLIVKDE